MKDKPTNELIVAPIRLDQRYGWGRVKILVFLGKTRIPMQFDIGVGDAVTPMEHELS